MHRMWYMFLFSVNVIQAVIEIVERFCAFASAKGQFFIFTELKEKTLGQFLNRLLECGEKLLIGKIACCGAFLKTACNQ